MSKILIITNHSYMLYRFRLELIQELMKEHEVVLSMPFVGHEEDFPVLGLRCIMTDLDRISGTFFLCAAPPNSDRLESLGDQQMKVYLECFAMPEMFLNVGGDLFVLPYLQTVPIGYTLSAQAKRVPLELVSVFWYVPSAEATLMGHFIVEGDRIF